MKLSIELAGKSKPEWVETVISNFPAFLQDHANCERKASAMAMSFIAKYPNRTEIIPELIATAVEELEHFKAVYEIMNERGIELTHEISKDLYVQELLNHSRSGRNERFLDRLLLASIIECRGAERFRLVHEALNEKQLKEFYHKLWASEAKHGNIFVKMSLTYFKRQEVYARLEELNHIEAVVLNSLPLKAALH